MIDLYKMESRLRGLIISDEYFGPRTQDMLDKSLNLYKLVRLKKDATDKDVEKIKKFYADNNTDNLLNPDELLIMRAVEFDDYFDEHYDKMRWRHITKIITHTPDETL